MSLLDEIRKKKSRLSHTETFVRDQEGNVFLEDLKNGCKKFQETSVGYVVDTKPDLSVAEVLPGLLMGSQDVTQCCDLLDKYKIDHILSLGVDISKFEGCEYTFVNILDLPEVCLREIFNVCFPLIDSVRNNGKNIFVHCNAGVSRSASIVIGYLMKEKGMCFKEAFGYLKNIRPCIRPNEGFTKQLLMLEKVNTL